MAAGPSGRRLRTVSPPARTPSSSTVARSRCSRCRALTSRAHRNSIRQRPIQIRPPPMTTRPHPISTRRNRTLIKIHRTPTRRRQTAISWRANTSPAALPMGESVSRRAAIVSAARAPAVEGRATARGRLSHGRQALTNAIDRHSSATGRPSCGMPQPRCSTK